MHLIIFIVCQGLVTSFWILKNEHEMFCKHCFFWSAFCWHFHNYSHCLFYCTVVSFPVYFSFYFYWFTWSAREAELGVWFLICMKNTSLSIFMRFLLGISEKEITIQCGKCFQQPKEWQASWPPKLCLLTTPAISAHVYTHGREIATVKFQLFTLQ